MCNWLYVANNLANAGDTTELVNVLLDTLKRQLNAQKSFVVALTPDGRQLVALSREPRLTWDVTNFESPFAHVLQNSKQKIITYDDLVFWQRDKAFISLIKECCRDQQILITPLMTNQGNIVGLLVILLDKLHWSNFERSEYDQLLSLFNCHWGRLNKIQNTILSKRSLKESLSYAEKAQAILNRSDSIKNKLLGDSAVMTKLREQIATVSLSDMTVLIQGETGVGKDVVATAIHKLSTRSIKPFVTINCAAIPENLLESELFGYVKGAFSGAVANKSGLISHANGGTLFLDEIGDMPPMLQAKLLRVLETKQFRPLGAEREVSSDFRLIAATHVDLRQKIKQKIFRQDLYYRLYQYPLYVPNLKEHMDDVELLVKHFITQFNQKYNTQVRGIHYRTLDLLLQYHFPGNVRELRHLVEFSCAHLQNEYELMPEELSKYIEDKKLIFDEEQNNFEVNTSEDHPLMAISDLRSAVKNYESKIISLRLCQYKGDKTRVAESLGIPKRTLADKCSKLEINV